jgi:hypothetical protein
MDLLFLETIGSDKDFAKMIVNKTKYGYPFESQKTNVQSDCYNGSNNDICYCTIAASRFS